MSARNHNALTSPLVTVFMAVYNTGEYLKLAVDSVLQQTYSHFELIIVNDGSTDNSDEIILTYSDERIIYIKNEINQGIVKTRNLGLDKMSGKYLAILDSDDIALPDRIEKQVAFMEENPEYGLCGSFFNVINSEGLMVNRVRFPQSDQDIKAYLKLGNCFCHSTVIVLSELVRKYRYSDAKLLGEDYHLYLELSEETKYTNLPFFGANYRVHRNNVSYKMNTIMYDSIKEINRHNLLELNIPFTEELLDLHSHFLIFDADYFNDQDNFLKLEAWVKTLVAATQADPVMNNPVIFKFLLHRWFVICYKKRMMKRVLFTNMLTTYKMKYVVVMLEEAYDHSASRYLRKLGRAAVLSIK